MPVPEMPFKRPYSPHGAGCCVEARVGRVEAARASRWRYGGAADYCVIRDRFVVPALLIRL